MHGVRHRSSVIRRLCKDAKDCCLAGGIERKEMKTEEELLHVEFRDKHEISDGRFSNKELAQSNVGPDLVALFADRGCNPHPDGGSVGTHCCGLK